VYDLGIGSNKAADRPSGFWGRRDSMTTANTFQNRQRAHWADVIRAAKAGNGMFSVAHQKEWAIRCLALPGPVGRLPA
jgi:hypothetical protein